MQEGIEVKGELVATSFDLAKLREPIEESLGEVFLLCTDANRRSAVIFDGPKGGGGLCAGFLDATDRAIAPVALVGNSSASGEIINKGCALVMSLTSPLVSVYRRALPRVSAQA